MTDFHFLTQVTLFRLQGQGGGNGVKLTGDLAKGVMVGWDKLFKDKIERILTRTLLYKRYVDDQNLVVEAVRRGLRYNVDREQMEEMSEDDDRDDDERTFETIREIGNSVNPMIQLTVDYPGKHANGRFPILDLEVWIARTEEGHID